MALLSKRDRKMSIRERGGWSNDDDRASFVGPAADLGGLNLSPLHSVGPFKCRQDRAVIQRPAVRTALLDELGKRVGHDLHRLDLGLKLQLFFKRDAPHIS